MKCIHLNLDTDKDTDGQPNPGQDAQSMLLTDDRPDRFKLKKQKKGTAMSRQRAVTTDRNTCSHACAKFAGV